LAYIGKQPVVGNFQICDAISVVNGQAAYTMQVGSVNVSPESANHMIVSLNGTIQKPNSSFTVSGSTITFASNLATGDVIDFIQILGDVLSIGTPSDSTVSLAKLTATGTKDATTFLRGDNTFNAPPLGGITEADQWRVTANTAISGSSTLVSSNWERADNNFGLIGTGMTESSGVFTFPQTGIYKIDWQIMAVSTSGGADYTGGDIQYSTDNFSSSNNMAAAYNSMDATSRYVGANMTFIFDVTNTSTHKVRFRFISSGTVNFEGNTNRNWNVATFIRLGDT